MKRSPLDVLAIGALGALLSACSSASTGSSFPATAGTEIPRGSAHAVRPAQTYQSLYSFLGGSDGAIPQGGLINGQYGTTLYGGGTGCGGRGCGTVYNYDRTSGIESILYSFAGGSDGMAPVARLLYESGVYYGTTTAGGGSGCGGQGCGIIFAITQSGSESILHSFTGGSDGANPTSRLVDIGGTFYGTTTLGGGSGCGGQGCGTVYSVTPTGTSYSVLHRFTGGSDGAHPRGTMISRSGVLYGTTTRGGGSGCGGQGCGTVYRINTGGIEAVLHDFKGGTLDGEYPDDGLVASNSKFYGTTQNGGANSVGTVYSITIGSLYSVLYSFAGSPNDGANPTSVLLAIGTTLYGTTQHGGSYDQGTLYSLSEATTHTESVLHSFEGGSDGALPYSGVIQVQGTLYGTTMQGGNSGCYGYGSGGGDGCGTLYSLTP